MAFLHDATKEGNSRVVVVVIVRSANQRIIVDSILLLKISLVIFVWDYGWHPHGTIANPPIGDRVHQDCSKGEYHQHLVL